MGKCRIIYQNLIAVLSSTWGFRQLQEFRNGTYPTNFLTAFWDVY